MQQPSIQQQQRRRQQQQQQQRTISTESLGSVLSQAFSSALSRASSISGTTFGGGVGASAAGEGEDVEGRVVPQAAKAEQDPFGRLQDEDDELQMEREPGSSSPLEQQQQQQQQLLQQPDVTAGTTSSSSLGRLGPLLRQGSTTSTASALSTSARYQQQTSTASAGRRQQRAAGGRQRQRLLSREEAEEARREREARSIAIEKAYVHDVYEQISLHVSDSRYFFFERWWGNSQLLFPLGTAPGRG